MLNNTVKKSMVIGLVTIGLLGLVGCGKSDDETIIEPETTQEEIAYQEENDDVYYDDDGNVLSPSENYSEQEDEEDTDDYGLDIQEVLYREDNGKIHYIDSKGNEDWYWESHDPEDTLECAYCHDYVSETYPTNVSGYRICKGCTQYGYDFVVTSDTNRFVNKDQVTPCKDCGRYFDANGVRVGFYDVVCEECALNY